MVYNNLLWLIFGYLLGSIPSAVILGKIYGIKDIRNHGSGNMGTLNVYRTIGLKYGLVTLLLDLGKGLAASHLAYTISGEVNIAYLVTVAAIVGHMFPLYVNFQGGKSLAVYAGSMIFLEISVLLITFLGWILFYLLTDSISFSSLLAFGVLPPLVVLLGWGWSCFFLFITGSSLILAGRQLIALRSEF